MSLFSIQNTSIVKKKKNEFEHDNEFQFFREIREFTFEFQKIETQNFNFFFRIIRFLIFRRAIHQISQSTSRRFLKQIFQQTTKRNILLTNNVSITFAQQ